MRVKPDPSFMMLGMNPLRNLPQIPQEPASNSFTFRKYMVIFILALTITFLLYVQGTAIRTSNWKSTRKLGYSQNNLCTEPNFLYDIFSNATVNMDDVTTVITVNTVFMNYNGEKYICFSSMETLGYLINNTGSMYILTNASFPLNSFVHFQ